MCSLQCVLVFSIFLLIPGSLLMLPCFTQHFYEETSGLETHRLSIHTVVHVVIMCSAIRPPASGAAESANRLLS